MLAIWNCAVSQTLGACSHRLYRPGGLSWGFSSSGARVGGWKPGGSGRTAQTAACAGSGNGAVSPLACAGCLGVWVPAGGSPCSRGCGRGRGVQSHLCVGFAPMCLLPRSARVSDPQHVAGEPRGLQVGAPCCPPLPGLRTPRQPPDGHVSPPLPGENS